MKIVALLGTFDTKGAKYNFLREAVRQRGLDVLLIDCGIFGSSGLEPDVSAQELAEKGGSSLAALQAAQDRGEAVRIMGLGARAKVTELQRVGKIHGL